MRIEKEDIDDLYFKALKLEEDGDVDAAFRLYMQCALAGEDGAQNAVGYAYDKGAGVKQDKEKAIFWYKKAWRTSHTSAWAVNTAITYAELGRRRPALYWWKKAMEVGGAGAALSLAKFLLNSQTRRDLTRIIDLVKMAAEGEARVDVSEDEKEEAQELLEKLSSGKM